MDYTIFYIPDYYIIFGGGVKSKIPAGVFAGARRFSQIFAGLSFRDCYCFEQVFTGLHRLLSSPPDLSHPFVVRGGRILLIETPLAQIAR